jgi:hypothetical protein
MPDKFFLSATGTDLAGGAAGARVLWSGHCAVAEYAFEEPASLPRWTLPEETEVLVLEDRVVYRDVLTGATGELCWPWPQHLRVQPGNRETGRAATVTQIQLVCAGPGGAFPALVFAGGELATVRDADRVANVLRQAIARYRVEHAAELGVPAPQVRMLSRLVIGPEFNNYQGGEGQTVSLLGSVVVEPPVAPRRSAIYAVPPEPLPTDPFLDEYFSANAAAVETPLSGRPDFGAVPPQTLRPGFDPAATRSPARPADEASMHGTPDLAARAAELAARVASLVSGGEELARYETRTTNLSSYLSSGSTPPEDQPASRAEQIRRTAARLAANSARNRTLPPRRPADDELGTR